jgi:hypothetical protein
MLEWQFCYKEVTTFLQFTMNVRKCHRQPHCTFHTCSYGHFVSQWPTLSRYKIWTFPLESYCVCVCVCVCARACARAYVRSRVHTRSHARMYTHTDTYTEWIKRNIQYFFHNDRYFHLSNYWPFLLNHPVYVSVRGVQYIWPSSAYLVRIWVSDALL